MRIHMQSFIIRHGQNRQGRTVANRYKQRQAENNPRASVGRRSANSNPEGKAERINQEHGQESTHRNSN